MNKTNLLIIMDDEHSASALGCAGHPIVKTPNIDRLATRGTHFINAYSNNPICVPARALLATGQYTHKQKYWDNCIAYDGNVKGWGHALQKAGIASTSIGKLHYLNNQCPTGFDQQIIPMHVHEGGDTMGLVRDDPLPRPQCRDMAEQIGPGETQFTRYDRKIRDEACQWLRNRKESDSEQPWVTFVSFICPHYPLVAPQEFYDLYNPDDMPLPKARPTDGTMDSDWWKAFDNCYLWERYFESDEQKQIAIASYYGLCSFIDDLVGSILTTLEETGFDQNTQVMFFSDHGEALGARGQWAKSTMFDESVRVPMIMAGPGLAEGEKKETPVSLIDVAPTILQSQGLPIGEELPGRSLIEIADLPDDEARMIFSEYHATASKSAEYMLKRGRYKYVHFVGYPAELYDLKSDPEELRNLAQDDRYAGLMREFDAMLRDILDPEAVDREAKAAQQILVDHYGGREGLLAKGSASATPAPK